MSVIVKHTAFKPYELNFPINWTANPYNNKNWVHHFNSLRWLPGIKDLDKVEKVLREFYKFHCIKKERNPYYNEMRGDHAASIRIGVLHKIKDKFSSVGRVSGIGICNRLIKEEIKNLQSEKLYRAGHNHGLMVDLALLSLMLEFPEYNKQIDLSLVAERSAKTLDAMWHQSGLTKEHSVSYQEYNIPLTIKYFDTLDKLCLESSAKIDLNRVLEESKKFLGYALKSNGEYFPLGDSSRWPNKSILNKVFGRGGSDNPESAHKLLSPYSFEEGCYANENFFIYRKIVNGRKIHFAATCCWDSYNHKQNDELSFILEVDGATIFDDPGYTGFTTWDKIKGLKSEFSHSTIIANGKKWSDARVPNGKSKIAAYHEDAQGFSVEMRMSRYDACDFIRHIEFDGYSFSIFDQAIFHEVENFSLRRQFVLGAGVQARLSGGDANYEFEICKDGDLVSFNVASKESAILTEVDLVSTDRKVVEKTNAIVLINELNQESLQEGDGRILNLPTINIKLNAAKHVKNHYEYDNESFFNNFYYKPSRPKNSEKVIELSKGFLNSEKISIQRRAAAGVVGIYKSIELGKNSDLSYMQKSLYDILPLIVDTAADSERIIGVRDDPKQVTISVFTALWHSEIMVGDDPTAGLFRFRNEVNRWSNLEVPYSQNVARSITLLSYLCFSRQQFDEALDNIEWLANFVCKINKEASVFRNINSSYCGDLHKAIGLLQVCIAGREWMNNTRKREKYWSPKALLSLCPRIRKGDAPEFDKKFICLLKR